MLNFFWSLLACALFLPLSEVLLLFSLDVDVLGNLDNPTADLTFNGPAGLPLPRPLPWPRPLVVPFPSTEVVDFPFVGGLGLLAAAALRRWRALSSLGSSRVSNALHVFLTQ